MLNRKIFTIFGLFVFGVMGLVYGDENNVVEGSVIAEKMQITKQEIEEAMYNLVQQKEHMIALMVSEYKKMSKKKRRETIQFIKQQINKKHQEQMSGPEDIIAHFAMSGLAWYLGIEKEQKARFFSSDTEREKFEKAIFVGELIGMSPREDGINIVTIGDNAVLMFRGDVERATMLIFEKMAKDLEGQAEKIMEQKEGQEAAIQKCMTSLFEKYAAELKDKFLYNLLLLHLTTKMTKSWLSEVLAAIRNI